MSIVRTIVLASGLVLLGTTAVRAQATSVVYLVRHAETESDGTRDPGLSQAGQARAERLARMLSEAGLTGIYTTGLRRTASTAGAVARATGLTPQEYDPAALRAFAEELRGKAGRHLVVGHSNTTPALVQLLGGDPGGPITEDDYGRIYQLTLGPDGVHTAILGYPGGFLADPPESPASAEADPEDAASIDAIVAALYDVISGPAGEARDWDRLRSLFLPSARMVPVQRAPDGRVAYRAMSVQEYVQSSGPAIEQIGFTEREIARQVAQFGDVAHVFSTYEGRQAGVEEPIVRGLNSIQLIYDGTRWWISSLAWSPERADLPIPPEYLPSRSPS